MSENKPNAFIVCTGVGHINRGYESFTMECFKALSDDKNFTLYLLKGAGESGKNEIRVNCTIRNSKMAAVISKITGKETYWVEQATFLIGMLPSLIRYKPAVIFYSDFILGSFLFHLGRFFKFKYKLLFSNGAPNGPPFSTMDHVQQLLPVYLKTAINKGAPAEMQTLLPYGFDIDINDRLNNIDKKKDIVKSLGLPTDKKIVISVGAINKNHKRMDYTINEVAKLPEEYFLVILGQFEAQTTELIALAKEKLPGRHQISNVSYEKVKEFYVAADYFVLASLVEGFGRVLIEAASYGLPCFVNDYINAKEVLGEYGTYVDMQKEGALCTALKKNIDNPDKEKVIKAVYERYSWDKLKSKYSELMTRLIV